MSNEKVTEFLPIKVENRKFTKDQLRAHSQEVFGVTPVVFDGALCDVNNKITKEDAKKKIDAWLNKKVSKNQGEVK